ncbi:conserved hypothetical protein [Deferribacter desulfuricans SSM1]|uniref:PPM-type phosphatase domain-containing protein n=1 Tax=Deferribacter desulfuricans (strain DSM 14783 / JCM 11476 / NBRC 101012 / SSM1) TaxID=639282 RepID=D3P8R0_DEFDS|nr:PP2C family protein-serine/threonine phosphatase [Deferribacter desulfuricans]BAI81100.1 conserved hypothetical protein [Deferribacter desulfuricans SSM1]
MKNLSNIYNYLSNLFKSDSLSGFEKNLISFFKCFNPEKLIVLKEERGILASIYNEGYQFESFIDISDVYNYGIFNEGEIKIDSFDEKIEGDILINVKFKNKVFFTVVLKLDDLSAVKNFKPFFSSFGYKYYELMAKESRLKAFVLYQQKIEFIKNADFILSILDEDEVIIKSLAFFVDTFSAEAAFVKYNGKFNFIGLDSDDLKLIKVEDSPIEDLLIKKKNTIFVDSGISCDKFNINNIFIIYIEEFDIYVVLFNIKYDFIPDKEFAEIISSILRIALKNAIRHKEIVNYKLQEQEINYTVEILNKFSSQRIDFEDENLIATGINRPAKMAGGDFLDFRVIDDGYFSTIADVCGKGYSASILTVVLSTFIEVGVDIKNFIEKLELLNSILCKKNFDGKFITAFFSYYNKNDGLFRYISLGHEPAFLISNGECKELKSEYLPIGIFEEKYSYFECKINSGDKLFIYSDGITEYIEYNDIKNRLLEMKNYDKDFIDKFYTELVFDKEKQKDDFTCLYLYFK